VWSSAIAASRLKCLWTQGLFMPKKGWPFAP
jgi:hypothetical protein